MTGRKTCALYVPPVVPYKALENFSKALYGTSKGYLQCTIFPSCHVSDLFAVLKTGSAMIGKVFPTLSDVK